MPEKKRRLWKSWRKKKSWSPREDRVSAKEEMSWLSGAQRLLHTLLVGTVAKQERCFGLKWSWLLCDMTCLLSDPLCFRTWGKKELFDVEMLLIAGATKDNEGQWKELWFWRQRLTPLDTSTGWKESCSRESGKGFYFSFGWRSPEAELPWKSMKETKWLRQLL